MVARSIVGERLIGSEEDMGDEEFDEYWTWAKGLVSSYMLECSIRVRSSTLTLSQINQKQKK